MKKLFLATLLVFAIGSIKAQEVGLRFGEVIGNNVAIDAVFGTGESRLHADLSFGSGVGVELLWDLLYRPLGTEELYWYVGVGPSLYLNDPLFLGASGEIGLEYRFQEVPLVLGLDWRPTFWLIEETDFLAEGFGLNLRWNFNN